MDNLTIVDLMSINLDDGEKKLLYKFKDTFELDIDTLKFKFDVNLYKQFKEILNQKCDFYLDYLFGRLVGEDGLIDYDQAIVLIEVLLDYYKKINHKEGIDIISRVKKVFYSENDVFYDLEMTDSLIFIAKEKDDQFKDIFLDIINFMNNGNF